MSAALRETLLGQLNAAQIVLITAALYKNVLREHATGCPAALTVGGFCTCGKWDAETALEALGVSAIG